MPRDVFYITHINNGVSDDSESRWGDVVTASLSQSSVWSATRVKAIGWSYSHREDAQTRTLEVCSATGVSLHFEPNQPPTQMLQILFHEQQHCLLFLQLVSWL